MCVFHIRRWRNHSGEQPSLGWRGGKSSQTWKGVQHWRRSEASAASARIQTRLGRFAQLDFSFLPLIIVARDLHLNVT